MTFRYKGRPNVPEERHYGLIAEEVNEIIPGLMAHSADGKVESVKYHVLGSRAGSDQGRRACVILERVSARPDTAAEAGPFIAFVAVGYDGRRLRVT